MHTRLQVAFIEKGKKKPFYFVFFKMNKNVKTTKEKENNHSPHNKTQ